jgi:hypothetical protein
MLQTIDVDDLESCEYNPLLLGRVKRAKLTAEICKIAVKYNSYSLLRVPKKFLSKELFTIAVMKNGFIIKQIPDKYLTQELCDLAVMQNPVVFGLLKPRFKTPALCWLAVEQDPQAWSYVPKRFQTPELKAKIGTIIARSSYILYRRPNGLYQAGCHRNLTLEQALTYWGPPRNDKRARVFHAALLKEQQKLLATIHQA